MHRLRHPIRAIREPFGTAGLIIACVALIAALGGTALAAAKLNGTQKKEVEKIAKKFAGKPGATGPAGPAGAKGDAGSAGAMGDAGTNGVNGTNGTNGKSVAVTSIAAGGSKCEGRAGAEVKQEGAPSGTAVCEGSPWTAGGTLPPGQTETGTWSMSLTNAAGGTRIEPNSPISFSIPLASAGGLESAFAFNQEATSQENFGTSGCAGTVEEPTAPPGKLCVYTLFENRESTGSGSYEIRRTGEFGTGEYGVSGAILVGPALLPTATEFAFIEAYGSWAVTAPTS